VAAALGYALVLIFTPFFRSHDLGCVLAFSAVPVECSLAPPARGTGIAAVVLRLLAPITILLPLSALSIEFVKQISGCCKAAEAALNGTSKHSRICSNSHGLRAPTTGCKRMRDLGRPGAVLAGLGTQAGFAARGRLQRFVFPWVRAGFLFGFAIMLFLLFFFARRRCHDGVVPARSFPSTRAQGQAFHQ